MSGFSPVSFPKLGEQHGYPNVVTDIASKIPHDTKALRKRFIAIRKERHFDGGVLCAYITVKEDCPCTYRHTQIRRDTYTHITYLCAYMLMRVHIVTEKLRRRKL